MSELVGVWKFWINCIIINFTFINMLLKWLQQEKLIGEHMTRWVMKVDLKRFLKVRN
jgi:hypothetical protein